MKSTYIWQKPKSLSKKFNVSSLKNIETATSFQLELSNRFLPLLDNLPNEVEEFSNAINNHIIETAEKITPPVREPLPNWMQTDTTTAINNKKAIRQKYGDSSIQYKVAKAETKKLVKRDKINNLNDELDELSNLPPDKQFFLAMKKLKTTRRNISWGIKDKNGEILTSKDDILERWALFYEELYNDPTTCDSLPAEEELLTTFHLSHRLKLKQQSIDYPQVKALASTGYTQNF